MKLDIIAKVKGSEFTNHLKAKGYINPHQVARLTKISYYKISRLFKSQLSSSNDNAVVLKYHEIKTLLEIPVNKTGHLHAPVKPLGIKDAKAWLDAVTARI